MLELGCGTATPLTGLARGAQDRRFVGTDGDADIRNRAPVKLAAAAAIVELPGALAGDLPLPDGSVEVAIATLVPHHLSPEGKRRALTELRRVPRPGGALVIADWRRTHDPLTRAAFLPMQPLNGVANARGQSAGRLPSFIRDAGFGAVVDADRWKTAFGSLDLFSAKHTAGAPGAAASDHRRDSPSPRCEDVLEAAGTVRVSFPGRRPRCSHRLACAELPQTTRLERSTPTPLPALLATGPDAAGATSAPR
jgi:SAM-dependent methyltransferase